MNTRTALILAAMAVLAFSLGSLTTQAQGTDLGGCRDAAAHHWREAAEAGDGLSSSRGSHMERAESYERLHELGASCEWWSPPA